MAESRLNFQASQQGNDERRAQPARSSVIEELVQALRCLPGVGPKSAQRMAYHLLQRDREGGSRLSLAIGEAVARVGNCLRCRTLTDAEICDVCADDSRDPTTLCIVETPADMIAIDKGTGYRGLFFVLMGHLSPLDGIGPEQIGLDILEHRLDRGEVREVVLATSSTVEGQATAHYIGEMVRTRELKATRLAYGIPLGGELEFIDSTTLAHAFQGRTELD
jgi:recombination protein RecR